MNPVTLNFPLREVRAHDVLSCACSVCWRSEYYSSIIQFVRRGVRGEKLAWEFRWSLCVPRASDNRILAIL